MNTRHTTLRAAAEVSLGRQRSPQHDFGPHMVPYLRAANVKDGVLDLSDVKEMNFTLAEQQIFNLRPGDVLVTEGSGSLKAVGASAVWRGEIAGTVCFQNTLLRMRPRDGRTDGRFLEWWARSTFGSGIFASIATGANIYHISAERVRALPFALPPLEEQRRIADFLDAETKRINALSKSYERMKSLAAERSQTTIDTEIDQEPTSTPLRYVVRFREGPGIMALDFQEVGVPLIRISGLQEGEVTTRGCNFLNPEKVARQWPHFRLQLGDRLISGSATMGSVSIVRDPGVVGAIPYTGLIILRPARADVEMNYVEAFLKSSKFSRQIDALKTGATMQHFGPTHLSQVNASLPSVEDQRRVVDKVGNALRFSEQVTRQVNRQVTLLAERRQALITAAVTGQFDVSTASGRNVTDGVPA